MNSQSLLDILRIFELLFRLLGLVHSLHVLVESLEVAGDDGDGQGEDQHPRHGAQGPHQLPDAWSIEKQNADWIVLVPDL